jgi:hypothetical protein
MNKIFVTRDTINYPIPSGYTIYVGFQQMGWSSHYIAKEYNHNLNEYDFGGEVDIFFDYVNLHTNPNHIEELKEFKQKNPNCKIFVACYLPYDHNKTNEIDSRFEGYVGLVEAFFNTTIQHNKAKNDFHQIGLNYLNIPFPAITDVIEINQNPIYDVSFIGTIDSGYRFVDVWLPIVDNSSLKTAFYGFNNYPNTTLENTITLSNQSKICLNPHYLDQIEETEDNIHSRMDFNTRVFMLPQAGCFQLTNHPYMKKVFGNEYPVFDKTNFKDMFYHYLNNEEERHLIIKQMQNVVEKNHTSKIYAEKLISKNYNFI